MLGYKCQDTVDNMDDNNKFKKLYRESHAHSVVA